MSPPGETPALLLIVSGPAGSGKTTLCDRMLAEESRIQRIVTATTRPPRPGEREGVDYYFLSERAFERKVETGEFFEWARVHGRLYGCLKAEVRDKLSRDIDLLLNIDVQGAATFRRAIEVDPELKERVVSIFVTPESIDVIRERLEARGQDNPEEIERRLKNAKDEISEWIHYDYCLISGDREADFLSISSIHRAEKLRNRNKSR